MTDPFPVPEGKQLGKEGPWMSSEDNWVSFSFNSDVGYDKILGTVHGSPDFVADKLGVKNFDGKLSTLMQQAVNVDAYFKKWYRDEGEEGTRPKA